MSDPNNNGPTVWAINNTSGKQENASRLRGPAVTLYFQYCNIWLVFNGNVQSRFQSYSSDQFPVFETSYDTLYLDSPALGPSRFIVRTCDPNCCTLFNMCTTVMSHRHCMFSTGGGKTNHFMLRLSIKLKNNSCLTTEVKTLFINRLNSPLLKQ